MRKVVALALLAGSTVGCGLLLGIDDWTSPPGLTGAGAGAGGTTLSTHAHASSGTLDPNNTTCADGLANGMETDLDCGGDACPPCAVGKRCENDADCATGNCADDGCQESGLCCQPSPKDAGNVNPLDPTCADGVTNGLETDVDCGGDACAPCALGLVCGNDADCVSGYCGPCASSTCCAPRPDDAGVVTTDATCADARMNGLETDIDCGGDACLPCASGRGCDNDADCVSGHCKSGICD